MNYLQCKIFAWPFKRVKGQLVIYLQMVVLTLIRFILTNEKCDLEDHLEQNPVGGLCMSVDRDQQSCVFFTDPKKYFSAHRRPQKILFQKSETLKILFRKMKP